MFVSFDIRHTDGISAKSRLSVQEWCDLEAAGWIVYPDMAYARIEADSVAAARMIWQAALPKQNPDMPSHCEYCEAPFWFDVMSKEDWAEMEAEDEDSEEDFNAHGDYGDRSDFYEPYDRF
jgi:hypothetical protein